MQELINLGFNTEEIEMMLMTNPDFLDFDIKPLIDVLSNLNCSSAEIKDILIFNPLYLSRNHRDILSLIQKLLSLQLPIHDLITNNPNLLNYDDFEIDDYLNNNLDKYSKTELINILIENPYILDEI